MNDLLSKLEVIKLRFDDVATQIVDPEVIADMSRYIKLNKDYKELGEVVNTYEIYKNVLENIASSKELIQVEKDEEFKEMAKLELEDLESQREKLEEEIKILLLPKDPEDSKMLL